MIVFEYLVRLVPEEESLKYHESNVQLNKAIQLCLRLTEVLQEKRLGKPQSHLIVVSQYWMRWDSGGITG